MNKKLVHSVKLELVFIKPLTFNETSKLAQFIHSGFENTEWGIPMVKVKMKPIGERDDAPEHITAKKLLEIEKESGGKGKQ